MPALIKNWKLNLIALFFFCLFIALGNWQLMRAKEKKQLLHAFQQRMHHTLSPSQLTAQTDSRFYRLTLTGTFDNQHTLLLDNKTFNGKIGYQVYTPFISKALPKPILVDRGFVPLEKNRSILPLIPPIQGQTTVSGILNLPPRYFSLGQIDESKKPVWPLRVQYINLEELTPYTGPLLMPYVLLISPDHPAGFAVHWQIVMTDPAKHQGYAIQWFAFALTLLIIFVALNRR